MLLWWEDLDYEMPRWLLVYSAFVCLRRGRAAIGALKENHSQYGVRVRVMVTVMSTIRRQRERDMIGDEIETYSKLL